MDEHTPSDDSPRPTAEPDDPVTVGLAWYHILSETAPDGILILDAQSTILAANPAAGRIFGYAPGELIGQPLTMLIPQRLRERHNKGIQRYLASGVRHLSWEGAELPGLTRAGEEIPLEIAFGESMQDGRHIFAGFIRDIRQRKEAEAERERLLLEARHARKEAEEANRSKSEFLSTMSHEIRTPINAIIGYADLLDLGLKGPLTPGQREQLERIRVSSQHLLGLVNDVLDLAKVEAGHLTVMHQRAVAVHATTGAIALVGPQAAERGIEVLDPCLDDPDTTYVGDEDRVRQILVNLLSNAVKFTAPGGRVRITCGTTTSTDEDARLPDGDRWTYIRVQDTGIGIAPESLESVFQPFRQVQTGTTRDSGGSGLGLTISRRLARLMGGDLTVRSAPGEGSTFTLWLARPEAPDAAVEDIREMAGQAGELVVLGRALQECVIPIVEAVRTRLQGEPGIPAAGLGAADLEDHVSTFLTDLAQLLVILDTSKEDPVHLMRDGTEIQRAISELHGGQRARLGWSEESMKREFQILREEVTRGIRQQLPQDGPESVDVLAVLTRLIDRAERISLRGFHGFNRGGR